jgi:class I fructose-bisphosphate aldolase
MMITAAIPPGGPVRETDIEGIDLSTLDSRIAHVTRCAFGGRRLVLFSGGASRDADALLEEVRAIRNGGAHGSIIGRNTFQRPRDDALDLLERIAGIYSEPDPGTPR